MGGLEAALIENAAVRYDDLDTDVTLPKIQVAYQYTTDAFSSCPFAGYQIYEIEGEADQPEVITAYVSAYAPV